MVREIKNQIELRIAKLEIEKSKAVNDRHYEYSCELGDQIKGLKMALEIVSRCQQNHGKTTKAASVKGLKANVEEQITVGTAPA